MNLKFFPGLDYQEASVRNGWCFLYTADSGKNWIFDTEIISFTQRYLNQQNMEERIEEIRDVCNYFYENRNFYRKALKIEGQNSFSEHFREYIMPIIRIRISCFIDADDVGEFELNFFTDALICAIERWLGVPKGNRSCTVPQFGTYAFLCSMTLRTHFIIICIKHRNRG